MKTALITGAASGIGRAFAEALAARGRNLVLLDVNGRGLAETAAPLGRSGTRVETAEADVANRVPLTEAVNELIPAEGIDLLVHCAAILGPGAWLSQAPEQFEKVIAVDLLGTANAVRAALPALARARGHAVLLASTAALHGWPRLAAYSAAKFAVAGFAEAIRAELAEQGIGLTVAFPLLIDTPLLQGADIPPILRRGRRVSSRAVVDKVLRAVGRRRPRVYVPETVRVIAALHGLFPSLLDWYGRRFGME
jgi:NAD(P)-dependent dehydrogenase (short-subunit alcohol dehydrogenase family)